MLREENKACFAFHISCHFSGKVPVTHDALCLRTLFGILACGEQIGYHQPFHSCISPFLCCSLNIKHSQPSVMGWKAKPCSGGINNFNDTGAGVALNYHNKDIRFAKLSNINVLFWNRGNDLKPPSWLLVCLLLSVTAGNHFFLLIASYIIICIACLIPDYFAL